MDGKKFSRVPSLQEQNLSVIRIGICVGRADPHES